MCTPICLSLAAPICRRVRNCLRDLGRFPQTPLLHGVTLTRSGGWVSSRFELDAVFVLQSVCLPYKLLLRT